MKKVPSSLYRLQLSEEFPLKKAIALLPLIKELGIDGVYCSPYFAAYSAHGYDITNPNILNPRIASPKEYELFCRKLKELNLYHLVDIVPNHMSITSEWFLDVLQKGKTSKYSTFFDIYWDKGKIKIPFIGIQYPKSPHYEFTPWKQLAYEAHYRRFFNINELIGVRIEDQTVFATHHKWILELIKKGVVEGLRIDHPDGLYDPETYFKRVRKVHKGLLIVEKILTGQETLPPSWPVDGTVGYEFLNVLTGIFVKKSKTLTDVYTRFIGKKTHFQKIIYENKKHYIQTEMLGDVEYLSNLLGKKELTPVLIELLAHFPVYRSYICPKGPISARDKSYIEQALKAISIKKYKPHLSYLRKIFSLKIDTKKTRDFLMRFQQLSAPIMAKGFEDITLYQYNRLLALNEVGSNPSGGGVTIDEFHTFLIEKQKKYPFGLLPTSTHDTKRSLDTRMQIATLSEIPEKWEKALQIWSKLNKKHKSKEGFPEANAEYFFYQILLGVWPSRPSALRMWKSFQKSIREARVYTSWSDPNSTYERACKHFVYELLKKNSPFLQSFKIFQEKLTYHGIWNSLAATAIQIGAPGIVDIYQGSEYSRYTLVDPDNRGVIRYSQSKNQHYKLIQKALHFRREHSDVFLKGSYIPLKAQGPQKEHVIAFLRKYKNEMCLVAALRFTASIKAWGNTYLILPNMLIGEKEIFSKKSIHTKKILLSELFSHNPYAWVYAKLKS